MKTVLILNGPNLNLLGTREPQVYGSQTLADVQALCERACAANGFALDFRQSNHEGVLVDWIQDARLNGDAIVINAAGLSYSSVPILDALLAHFGFAEEERPGVLITIDKLDKIERAGVVDELYDNVSNSSAIRAVDEHLKWVLTDRDGIEEPQVYRLDAAGIRGALPEGVPDELIEHLAGIGEAIARQAASRGAKVIGVARSAGALNDVMQAINGVAYPCDLSEAAQRNDLIGRLEAVHGAIDVVVNNAGVTGFETGMAPHDPEHASLADWREVHRVNLDGTFLGCRYAIGAMKGAGTGSIINISSRSGLVGIPGAAAYASSKAAIRNNSALSSRQCVRSLNTCRRKDMLWTPYPWACRKIFPQPNFSAKA